MKKRKTTQSSALDDEEEISIDIPHTHCKICGKMIIAAGDAFQVRNPWRKAFVCVECYNNCREACLSSSKSKSRVKRENGYF